MNVAADIDTGDRVDLVFPVRGRTLQRDHRALLAGALARRLPWLGQEAGTGVHRVNVVPGSGAQALLSARSRIVLRLARARAAAAAAALDGTEIDVDGGSLRLGAARLRELLPHRTLYAHFVACAGDDDEAAFLAAVAAELDQLGVACRVVCGLHQQVRTDSELLNGFSLMLDGLDAAASMRVMQIGIGPHRTLGCGIFVPHKSAAAVGA